MKTPIKFGVEIEGYIHGAGGERAASILLDAMRKRGIQTKELLRSAIDHIEHGHRPPWLKPCGL